MAAVRDVGYELLTAGKLAELLAAQVQELTPAWSALHPDLAQRLMAALDADPDQLLLPPMSYDEFLDWARCANVDNLRAEWADGKVIRMAPASRRHQQLVMFLSRLLYDYIYRRGLGELFSAPFQMRLAQVARGREPDLLFVAAEHLGRIRDTYLDGPADLVIEIVSPESAARDREEKYAEYETAGVREYWLIDPDNRRAEFFQLDENGRYAQGAFDEDGSYTSAVIPGLTVKAEWFWQEPLPPVWELVQL